MKKNHYEPILEAKLELIDDEDTRVERRQERLTPEQIADREAEKAGLLAAKRSERQAARDSGVTGNVDEQEIEHLDPRAKKAGARRVAEPETEMIAPPTPKALKDAEEDVRRIDQRLAEIDAQLKAARRAQADEAARLEAEHKSKLDAIRAEKVAAEQEANRLHAEREQAAFTERTQALEESVQRQDQAAKVGAGARSETLRRRVQPSLEAVRAAHRELKTLLRLHEPSLTLLMGLGLRSNRPAHTHVPHENWNPDTCRAFDRICADAASLRRDLNHAADSYSEKLPMLRQLLDLGWSPALDQDQNVNTALRYLDPQSVQGVVSDLRDQITKLSTRLGEFDLTSLGVEPRAWTTRDAERSRTSPAVTPETFIPPSTGGVDQQQFAEGM